MGPHCGYRKCLSADDKGDVLAAKYRGTSPNACYGRGACDADTGMCNCDGQNYFGDACQFSSCGAGMAAKADQCSGKGACNTLTGLCSWDPGTRGGSCIEGEGCKDCNYKQCEANCNGNNGMCDRISGKCVCNTFKDAENNDAYTGPVPWISGDGPSARRDISSLVSSAMVLATLSTTSHMVSVNSLLKVLVPSQRESLPTNATMKIGGRSSTPREASSVAEATLFLACSAVTAALFTALKWPSAAK